MGLDGLRISFRFMTPIVFFWAVLGYAPVFAQQWEIEKQQVSSQQSISEPQSNTQEQSTTEEQDLETIIVHPNQHDDWLHGFHQTISDSVFGSAKWFDSFFGTDEYEESQLESLARIRLGWEPRARDFAVFSQKFRLRIKLPNLKRKVDLIFSDEIEDENISKQFTDGRSLRNDADEDSFTAAIRMINIDEMSRFLDTRLGVSGSDVFAKARFKFTKEFGKTQKIQFQPSIYYYLDEGAGNKLFLEYEKDFSEESQLRLNYSWRRSESFQGRRWRTGVYYLHRIDRLQATSLGFVVNGEHDSDEGSFVDNYQLSYRYRLNAYRRWLFFEVEPFLEWPEEFDHNITPGIALRVEGYFKRKE